MVYNKGVRVTISIVRVTISIVRVTISIVRVTISIEANVRYAPKTLPLPFNETERNGSFRSRLIIFRYPFWIRF